MGKMFKKCKHDWIKQTDIIIPPPINQETITKIKNASVDFFTKTHVIILSCKKCGKIYKSVEKGC